MEQLIGECLLKEDDLLGDYIITHTTRTNNIVKSIGKIRNSNQLVLIRKQKFDISLLTRFKTLYRLFLQGIVLADNIFVKKQPEGYFFYIIEAYIARQQSGKFTTLQQLINNGNFDQWIPYIYDKLGVLLQACHNEGENYLCLTPDKIIIEQNTEIHVQFAPYELDQACYLESLRYQTNLYVNAYLAPQIFSQILLSDEGKLQVSKKDLIVADYWSLGCILLEMFVLASPAFLCVNAIQQQRRFEKFFLNNTVKDWSSNLEPDVKYLIVNCLEQKENRSMNVSFGKDAHIPEQESSVFNPREELILSDINYKLQDASLSLSLLALLDFEINEELKIVVHLFTKFTFYIEKTHAKQDKVLRIDKIINIENDYDQFSRLLTKQVQIDFENGDWKGTAQVNLAMLVLKHDDKRAWRKPIVGSYPISGCSSKIRISSFLNSTPDSEAQPLRQQINRQNANELANRYQSPEKLKFDRCYPSITITKPQQSLSNDKPKNKSSILAISQELSNLTILWRSKQAFSSSSKDTTLTTHERIVRI